MTSALHTEKKYEKVLTLGPIDKFLKQRKVPFKLLVDIFIVVLILSYVLTSNVLRRPYIRNSQDGFLLRFLPDAFFEEDTTRRVGLRDTTDGKHIFLMLTTKECVDWLHTISDRYFSLVNDSTETFQYPAEGPQISLQLEYDVKSIRSYIAHPSSDGEIWRDLDSFGPTFSANLSANLSATESESIRKEAFMNNMALPNEYPIHIVDRNHGLNARLGEGISPIIFIPPSVTDTQILTPSNPYGILSFSDTSYFRSRRIFFDHLRKLTMEFQVINADMSHVNPKPNLWEVTIEIDATGRGGMVPMKINSHYSDYVGVRNYFFSQFVVDPVIYLELLITITSFLSLILYSREIVRRVKLYILRKRIIGDRDWKDLFSVYITRWHIVIIVKDIFNTLGYLMCLVLPFLTRISDFDMVWTVLISLGGLLSLISVVRYLKFGNPYFYMTIRTLENGLPPLLRAVAGSMPVFIGFALCGNVWFGIYSRYFRSLDDACVTLFSVMNGDVVLNTFGMIYGYDTWRRICGRLFLYSFVTIFITGVFNLMLMILSNAYFVIKESLDEGNRNKDDYSDSDDSENDEYNADYLMRMRLKKIDQEEMKMQEAEEEAEKTKKEAQNREKDAKSKSIVSSNAFASSELAKPKLEPIHVGEEIHKILTDEDRMLLDCLSEQRMAEESLEDLFADSICDAIETKILARHMPDAVSHEIELLNYLRTWANAILSQKPSLQGDALYLPRASAASSQRNSYTSPTLEPNNLADPIPDATQSSDSPTRASEQGLDKKWRDDFSIEDD